MMMTTVLLFTAVAALAAIVVSRLAPTAPSQSLTGVSEAHRSNDHALRILAGRYARGEINVEEYRRMLILLRH
ncbi:MAG TPA: SHOCT domain-containing protein [Coriobacteriia bacterium]|nr:SHOCT domain-containing protein [Coriobacteriia bacterium]